MPAGDGTGPAGYGPMTGRAAGYCAGYAVPGYMNPVGGYGAYGRGFGRGRGFGGRGRGWRHWYYATGLPGWARAGYDWQGYPGYPPPAAPYPMEPSSKEEMDALKNQADFLKAKLEEVQERIGTLEKSGEGDERAGQ